MTIAEALNVVKANLNTIPVTGQENMTKLLGCIQIIDKCLGAVKTQEEEKHENPDPE